MSDAEQGEGGVPREPPNEGTPIPDPIVVTPRLPAAASAAPAALTAAERLEIRRRLTKTSIGIAPPALGSRVPPEPALELAAKAAAIDAAEKAALATAPSSPPAPTAPAVLAPSRPPPPTASTHPSRPPPPLPSRPPATLPSRPPPALPSRPPPAATEATATAATSRPPPPPALPRGISVPPLVDGTRPAPFKPPARVGGSTIIGTGAAPRAQPEPIVPRRRTPSRGFPAAPDAVGRVTPMEGTAIPKVGGPPGALAPDPRVALPTPVVKEKPGHAGKPPVLRIPQGGMLGSTAPMSVDRTGTLLCQILIKNGAITADVVDKAIALQEERGGQIGRILVSLGACSEEAIARALIQQLRARKDEGHWSDISAAARERKDVVGLKVLTRPALTVVTLIVTDLFSLVLAALLATSVHWFRTYSELQTLDWTAWLVVGPSIGLCMLTFLGVELYSPMAKSTPDEIRDITFAASLVHLGASLLSTLGDLPIVKWGIFVRGVWWAATLFLVPVIRSLVRNYLSVQPWWGIPVCVLGAAKTGRLIVRTLKAQPRSGLKPVMLLDDDHSKFGTLRASFTNEVMDVYSVNVSAAHFLTEAQRAELASDIFGDDDAAERASQPISSDHIPVATKVTTGKIDVLAALNASAASVTSPSTPARPPRAKSESEEFFGPEDQKVTRSQITKDASLFTRGKFAEVDGVPLVGDLSLAPILAQRLKIPYAVLAMPGVDSAKLLQIVERIGGKFTHLLIIPDLFGFATMGVPAKSLGGILGVEVRQQLLLPGPRLAKRCMDLALTALGSIFILPFLLLVALLIKLDSKGPVFYTQKRLGKDGGYFQAYKFRTMHGDGEERLKAILDADPALRAEYDIYHKLRKDPRVTRIGRILRKFSLDEFPQLLNVIRGDMTLVGPRPYIERELTEMSGQEKIILRAPPGMTGMWQVSDRNATSFAQRVQIDVYYVRNWSPWLDIHILAKTFGVVVRGSGV